MLEQDVIKAIIASEYDPFILPEDHPCYQAAELENWEAMEVPLEKIRAEYGRLHSTQGWIEWFESEVLIWDRETNEDEENRWVELERIYLEDPQSLPVILLEGIDGFFYVNDGHHRTAICFKNNLPTIFAIVGRSTPTKDRV